MNFRYSKQNRGIFISRPDSSLADLKDVARVICQTFKNKGNFSVCETIAQSYFDYRNQLKK